MKKLNNITILVVVLFLSFACDDILEEDITNDNVQIISPLEGTLVEGNTVQFLWKEVSGADKYRIQITKREKGLEVDSLINAANFVYNLGPGDYQWRIKAENFAYQTDYIFPVSFKMQASDNLTNQSVILKTPSENIYTNNKNLIFTWEGLSNVDGYAFVFIKKLEGEQTVLEKNDIGATSFNIEASVIDEDAEYIWSVKAVNATSQTPFSKRSLFIDTVTPNQPTLSAPVDKVEISPSKVTFNWANGTDSGTIQSAITNTLEISDDIDFNTLLHSSSTSNNSLEYEFSSTGTYYWRVRAIDGATNKSDYSIARSVIIK